jgi:histidine triad (HIT) family protein
MKIKKFLGICLARAVRYPLGQAMFLWSIAHMSTILPINRLRETNNLIAFYHPEPTYPVHILKIPKRTIPKFMDLSPSDAGLMMKIVQMVQSLVEELKLQEIGYRLIVNGGKYLS